MKFSLLIPHIRSVLWFFFFGFVLFSCLSTIKMKVLRAAFTSLSALLYIHTYMDMCASALAFIGFGWCLPLDCNVHKLIWRQRKRESKREWLQLRGGSPLCNCCSLLTFPASFFYLLHLVCCWRYTRLYIYFNMFPGQLQLSTWAFRLVAKVIRFSSVDLIPLLLFSSNLIFSNILATHEI